MAHKDELGKDSEGRFRRYIGWKAGDGLVIRQDERVIEPLLQALESKTYKDIANDYATQALGELKENQCRIESTILRISFTRPARRS